MNWSISGNSEELLSSFGTPWFVELSLTDPSERSAFTTNDASLIKESKKNCLLSLISLSKGLKGVHLPNLLEKINLEN